MASILALVTAGKAAKQAVEFMVSTYKRKYGKHGEKAVRALKRKLASARQVIKNLLSENKELKRQLADQGKILDGERKLRGNVEKQRNEFRELANTRLAIIIARDGGVVPLDEYPHPIP